MNLGRIALALAMDKPKGLASVASRGKWYSGTSDGTAIDVTYRSMHEALCDLESLVLMYGNFYNDGRSTNLGVPKINVSIDVDGVTYPLFFDNGNSHKTLPLGARTITDEIRISIKKGTRFFVRTHVLLNTGEKHPTGLTVIGAQNPGEGLMEGDATAGTFTSQNNNPKYAYAPLVILGEPAHRVNFKTVGFCGSSSSTGAGHTNTRVDNFPVGEVGFMQIGALRAGWGYVTAGQNGQKASDFVQLIKRTNQLQMLKNCDLVIVQYSSNDLADSSTTFEVLKENILKIHQVYWNMGIPTAQVTVNPRTTSTDGWTTLQNQTPINANFAPGANSARGKFNAWVMNNNDGIVGIDCNKGWESSPDSGLWAVDPTRTSDGIHPNNNGHGFVAADAVQDYLLAF
ncbi:hypothetical protein E6C60_3121 [Paenibacillus algicola]|uniref:SGNH hydrolase-type esterase domain-containing protein n=1 Tax=Paenibacillus algicola TaxID=2565926 RepID=A0A4P8XM25_9BACL|nr:SGNH/GDSL hydrolase family protein [Paenibacillus algicola]QCT03832.1 hypothetical protein E6C60_3121 [Paenibacillus algicola]